MRKKRTAINIFNELDKYITQYLNQDGSYYYRINTEDYNRIKAKAIK